MLEIKRGLEAKKDIENFATNKFKRFFNGCAKAIKEFARTKSDTASASQALVGVAIGIASGAVVCAGEAAGASGLYNSGISMALTGGATILDGLASASVGKRSLIQSVLTPCKTISDVKKTTNKILDKVGLKSR